MPMRVAMLTETNPTASEMREPCSSRERTSRPIWSVPNQCFAEGLDRIFFMSGLLGSQGARAGANTAMAMRSPTTTAPPHASWFREKVRQKRRSSPRPERAGPGTLATPPPRREPNAWVHDPIRQVGEEVGEQRQGRHDDEVAHDDRVVAREHRLDHELSHARDGEDALDDDAAADEAGQGETEDGDHGQERVAKGVLADDHGLGQSLGAGGLDIVLTDHLEHALAHVARES